MSGGGSVNDASFLSKSQLAKSHVDSLVTLGTAVLVLSISLLKDLTKDDAAGRGLIKWSWGLFALSIVSGIAYSFVLVLLVNSRTCWSNEKCPHRTILQFLNVPLHLCFFAGVTLFFLFGLRSI
jgi:hypothetical protein